MGIEDLGLLLENIEEYVMEQKKVVTYKWLSRTFSLNVNQAKQLLAIFHMKHKNMKHKSIQGVYYVSGMRTNSDGAKTHQICIVTEDLLEATKSQLDPITSIHLYSVQKGKPKETAPIYNVDFEQLKKKVYETTEFSMLRCKDAKISQVINNSLRPVTPPQLKNKVKVMSTSAKPDVKSDTKRAAPKKTTATLKTATKAAPARKPTEVKKTSAKNQGSLSNFFGKGKPETTQTKKPTTKTDVVKKEVQPVKSEVQPTKKDAQSTKKETQPKKTSPRKKSSPKGDCKREPLFVDAEILENAVEGVEWVESPKKKIRSPKKEPEVCSPKKESKPKTNGRTYSRGGAKRKRVIQFSDDEDLEMVAEETHKEKEDEGICMDTEDPVLSSPPSPDNELPDKKKPKVGRKRVRKQVSKTTVNEDGFMETEKVWEMVSCSENEEEEQVEVKHTEVVIEEKLLPVRSKQSNLMGFFKKG